MCMHCRRTLARTVQWVLVEEFIHNRPNGVSDGAYDDCFKRNYSSGVKPQVPPEQPQSVSTQASSPENEGIACLTVLAHDNPMSKLNRLVTIEAAFGSDIQHDVSMKVLTQFLEAWKQIVEAAHNKNKISINYCWE